MIATDLVARSPKDGYTLLFGTIALTINPILMPTKAPDVEKDLAPIVLVGSIPNILVVSKDLNVSSVKELITLAKQKPDELLYGAAGLGSGPQMATELFKQMAGIKMTGVLYPGSAQTVMDLVSGRIHVMFSPASTVLGFIKDGRVKALATSEAQRTSAAPDLPTIAEAALPGYATGLWFGILGPSGTPKPIIDKISEAANKALKDPDVLKQLEIQGLNALGGSPDDFARYIKSESERWTRILRDMDYGMPRSDRVPSLVTKIVEVLSPTNPLGIKAGGEGGTTAAPAVIVSAVVDALAAYGIEDIKMPVTPYRIWQAIHGKAST